MVRTWVVLCLAAGLAWGQGAEPGKEAGDGDPPGVEDPKEEAVPEAPVKTEDPPRGDAVVVTAERLETKRRLAGEAYGVVERRDLEIHRNEDVQQAVRFLPGVHIAQTSGKGGLTSLFIRGGESDHALVLVDGVEVNSDGGGIDLALFTNDGVGRLEIVRGSPSSVWGADSMAGVVHIMTKRGEGPPRVRISAEGGNYSTWRERLSFEAGTEEWGVTLALSRYDRWDGRWDHSDYRNTTAVGRFDYRIGEATSIRATVRYVDERAEQFAEDPGPFYVKEDPDGEKREDDLVLGLEVAHEILDGWIVTLRGSRFDEDVRFDDVGAFQYDSTSDFARTKFGLQSDATVVDIEDLRNVITAGVEWEREELTTSDSFSAGLGVNERRQNRALYIQNRFEAWDRLGITLSGRGDRSSSFGTAYTGRIAATFDIFDRPEFGTRPHGSFANGIKTPTMVESFSTNPFFPGNKRLDPEKSRTIDIGVEQRFWDDRIVVDLTLFENRMFDLVAFVGGDPAFENAGHARARGWELAVSARPCDWLKVGGGWTYQRTRVTDSKVSSITFEQGERLIRRPDNAGYLQAAFEMFYEKDVPASQKFEHPWFSIGVQAQYVGNRDDVVFYPFPDSAVKVRNNDYLKVDLTAEYWVIDRMVRVFGSVENLFDTPYQEVAGYPNDGITFFLGAEFTFEVPKLTRSEKAK